LAVLGTAVRVAGAGVAAPAAPPPPPPPVPLHFKEKKKNARNGRSLFFPLPSATLLLSLVVEVAELLNEPGLLSPAAWTAARKLCRFPPSGGNAAR